MKKIILSLTIIFSCVVGKAQITLDTVVTPTISMGDDFYLAQISETETKYVFLNIAANTFSLYNIDFTPFLLNISVPDSFSFTSAPFMQPLYITRTLFDCDSTNIEYAYYSPTGINKTFWIMRTDGTILMKVDSANGPYCIGSCLGLTDITVPIRKTSEGTKLFLQRFEPNRKIYIYSLCGELPNSNLDLYGLDALSYTVKVYPNPSSGFLTFEVNLPDNFNKYDLVITDVTGNEIKRKHIQSLNSLNTIDASIFSAGTYLYSLQVEGNRPFKTGKFLITK